MSALKLHLDELRLLLHLAFENNTCAKDRVRHTFAWFVLLLFWLHGLKR